MNDQERMTDFLCSEKKMTSNYDTYARSASTSPAGRLPRPVQPGAPHPDRAVPAGPGRADVVVCNRTVSKAAELCALAPEHLRPAGFDIDTLRREAAECQLLVNCTSLGMAGAGGQFRDFSFLDVLPLNASVVDLIYAPAETELLCRAREKGHHTANGFGLLVNQAVLSLEHFTDTPIERRP